MVIRFCRQNKKSVIAKILNGQLDSVASSNTNLVDEIIIAMHNNGVLKCLEYGIKDKRADNTTIPFDLVLALAVAAKMKVKTSLTDVPFAITDHRVLSELGYNLYDTRGNLDKGLMRESALRFILEKYLPSDFFLGYNKTIQEHIMVKLNISPDIHILDCTKLEVNFTNLNYEGSAVATDSDGKKARGYKLATIRGITQDTGIIEDIRFDAMNIHDFALSEDMLYNSPVLKHGDVLINDRGFLSREAINHLKSERGVDTYVPLKINMTAYEMAISTAKLQNMWTNHPNPKRKNQKVDFVSNLGGFWQSENPKNDVDFNACVVWNTQPKGSDDEFFVFITTDLTQTAKQIIRTYELRPEIEEDYRQLKDFWKLEDFKSTKLNMIAFHIICVLFGYLFFQLYTMLPEGEMYAHKSLPVILKNYTSKPLNYLVFYVGNEFGILTLIEFAKFYASCDDSVKQLINIVMA